jgi:hypothetical protein
LAIHASALHHASVSSNFPKELDLARFHQRAFFCLSSLQSGAGQLHASLAQPTLDSLLTLKVQFLLRNFYQHQYWSCFLVKSAIGEEYKSGKLCIWFQ